MGIALYELAAAYRALQEFDLHAENGGSEEGFALALSQLEGSIEEKAEQIAGLVRSLEAESDAYEAEWKRLKAEQDVRLRKVERIKTYLKQNLEAIGKDRLKAGLFTVTVMANPPAVQITEDAVLPDDFVHVVPEQRVPDKRALLDIYKAGGPLPEGVSVVHGTHLRIK